MSAYGYRRPTTPFLDSIRDQTLHCENAFSNAGTTYASLLTLLTGQLPMRTKVLYPPTPVQGDAAREHLPGMLRGRGYRTIQLSIRHYADAGDANLIGAFDMANYRWERILGQTRPDARAAKPFAGQMVDRLETRLLALWGMREGRDEFRQVTRKGDGGRKFWGDARRVMTLLQFIENSPEPWLAHVHLLDTHVGESPAARGMGDEHFDTTIRAADAWFKRIFAALEAKGQLDRTIVVISSDHGRNWEARERVPLMIRFPGAAHARREQRNVQLADVAPTILDYLGLAVPPRMDGLSLLRQQQLRDDRPVFTMLRAMPSSKGKVEVDPAPPNYGATSAAVIVGSQWLALDLEKQTTTTGEVPGHTAAGGGRMVVDDARRLLVAELTRSGFRIGPANVRNAASATKQAPVSAE
jgi:arylsulfatase A-like enzyme